jgi:predicted RNA-binding Zn ribbon-like protein
MPNFTFDSDRLCLDFMATLVDRDGAAIERLMTPDDLSDWFEAAGLSNANFAVSKKEMAAVLEFREQAHRIVQSVRQSSLPQENDVARINDWAARSLAAPCLNGDGRTATWIAKSSLAAGLSQIARDAIDLLTGPEFERLRQCSGTACSMLFIDTSRAQNRRWCSMERCGNRSKKAEFRRRRATGAGRSA